MFIIIRTNSEDGETKAAQAAREFFQTINPEMPVMIVPFEAQSCFITIDEDAEDGNQLIVIIYNGEENFGSEREIDIARGFNSVEDCWKYARLVAKVAGFSEDNIDADVFDIPQYSN